MAAPELPRGLEIRLVRSAPVADMIALYKDAGWWEEGWDKDGGFVHEIPRESALFAGAFMEKKLIGMGRALSDLKSDAYIQDVAVLSQYRGRGVGSMIIRTLVQGLRQRGVDWIGLIGEPGTGPFYENLGFRPMKGHIPFKLED